VSLLIMQDSETSHDKCLQQTDDQRKEDVVNDGQPAEGQHTQVSIRTLDSDAGFGLNSHRAPPDPSNINLFISNSFLKYSTQPIFKTIHVQLCIDAAQVNNKVIDGRARRSFSI
jgi:hypothetical protein